jgi:hypothetical protein
MLACKKYIINVFLNSITFFLKDLNSITW